MCAAICLVGVVGVGRLVGWPLSLPLMGAHVPPLMMPLKKTCFLRPLFEVKHLKKYSLVFLTQIGEVSRFETKNKDSKIFFH